LLAGRFGSDRDHFRDERCRPHEDDHGVRCDVGSDVMVRAEGALGATYVGSEECELESRRDAVVFRYKTPPIVLSSISIDFIRRGSPQ